MAVRVLAGSAAGWLSLYLLMYVWVVGGQGGQPARWYVALCLVSLLAAVTAALGVAPPTTTAIALVATSVAALAGVLTIGVLLLPAVVVLVIAVCRRPSRPEERERFGH